ncbi:Bug family tripartite tricarboxylate transporter substrate binding protein [Rivibacter subsaxonicus]|uniref:Tripartite-type tricarboxylate transporter receptor subunit TctC n=1 Tax=Rivibacter subsaxonicus TaxID=457575 RepID=A0A4Q7VWM1_9BURK|nr:tripartite tricarboxylate transporter substrate binding protein [Rivibacter subsaxonicus]RZU01070.1 tripartite-type tricarboxylate transporter receptor subunit TctC [Rivibacter subsaxonicus]
MNKLLTILCLTLATLAVSPARAQANTWPDKPVTIVVPFPPGGSTDSLARVLAPKLQEKLGQSFIVDNKAGATGTIGAGQVKRAAPDGYTLMVSSLGPFVIAPHLIKPMPYDALKDFELLTVAVQAPNVLVVPAASPLKSVADVIAAAKKDPGKMTLASSGNGSSDHLTAELFWLQTGTSGTHVPYKGGAPAIQDLLGGQVDASFQNVNAVLQHIASGKLRALAVTGDKRSAVLPNVPTLVESGVKGVDVYSWQAVAAPKGLPADIKSKLHGALVAALNDPAIKQKFAEIGIEVVANTPEQFAAFQQAEYARWKNVIETRKITAD